MGKLDKGEIEREQAERREYVKNIGIEYRFGCYEEKRGDSCHLLGEYMEAIDQNAKAALTLFRNNCEQRSYPKSCFKYAMYILAAKECTPERPLREMQRPLEVACSADIAKGCRYLGLVHWNKEKEKPIDTKKAVEFMEKACRLEDGEACWMLSTWYMGDRAKFKTAKGGGTVEKSADDETIGKLERDMEKSLYFGKRACDFDIAQSCANVARMFRLGDGIEKNLDKAKEYADKTKELVEILKQKDSNAGFTG